MINSIFFIENFQLDWKSQTFVPEGPIDIKWCLIQIIAEDRQEYKLSSD